MNSCSFCEGMLWFGRLSIRKACQASTGNYDELESGMHLTTKWTTEPSTASGEPVPREGNSDATRSGTGAMKRAADGPSALKRKQC